MARWFGPKPSLGSRWWYVRENFTHCNVISHAAGHVDLNGRDWQQTLCCKPGFVPLIDTYPNAAPPPGALFDNAPTVPAHATAPHLTPATRIAQSRNGQWYALNVLMQYGRPLSLDLALRRVGIGRTVFVRREDAATVMEAVGSGVMAGNGGSQ